MQVSAAGRRTVDGVFVGRHAELARLEALLGDRGPRALFVHGLAADLSFWYVRIALPLAGNYRALVYDLRGQMSGGMPTVSNRCSGRSTKRTRLPSASVSARILVVRPPRPMA